MAQIIKRGEKKYLIRIYLGEDERAKRHYYNTTVRCSYNDACKRARALETRRDLGDVVEPSRATLEGYLTEWLAVIEPRVSARTHKSYTSLLKLHLYPVIGWKRLASISPLDIEMAYTAMEKKGLSSRTIRYVHTVLNAALRQAVMWRLISHNPATDTDKRSRRGGREIVIKPLTEKELARFLKHAEEDPYYRIFLVAATTGLRPSEYLALEWKDFNAEEGTLSVSRVLVRENGEWIFAPPKTAKGRRTIPIPRVTVAALKQQKREQNALRIKTRGYHDRGLIFASPNGEPLDESSLRERHFYKVLENAKLERRRLYDLRHTWVTLSLAAGGNVKTISEWAGHASVAFTLDTYSHVIPSMEKKLSETMERLFSDRDAGGCHDRAVKLANQAAVTL